MDLLLDSNVIINYLNIVEPWYSIVASFYNQHNCKINPIIWSEVYYGTVKSKNPRNSLQVFEDFLKYLTISIIPIDKIIAREFTHLKINLERKNQKIHDFDLLIAASAIACNLTLITGNIKHFSRIKNLKIYNQKL